MVAESCESSRLDSARMCDGRSSSDMATRSRMSRGAFLWLRPVSTKFNCGGERGWFSG